MVKRLVNRFLLLALFLFTFCIPSTYSHAIPSRTSKVVLRFVWFGADFSAPVQKSTITIRVAGRTFRKKTNHHGWLVLAGIPCNQNATILFDRRGFMIRNPGEAAMQIEADRVREITRYVPCSDKPVGIGAFSWRDGEFIGEDMDNIDGCRTC